MEKLVKLDGALTPERTGQWRTNLQELIKQGSAAVPAIREFLAKNTDLDFGADGPKVMGYASAREGMIEALTQIGGPEAISVLSGTLAASADPREIALLAQDLDKLEPNLHKQEAISAAREALHMAGTGNLPGRDVAPLFEVFQKYGDASLIPELLQSTGSWNHYATFALAQLPDGAGVPALVKIANGQDTVHSGAKDPAIEVLGQLAPQNDAARTALLELVSHDQLTAYNWSTLLATLSGAEVHFSASPTDTTPQTASVADMIGTSMGGGSQNFYTAPTVQSLAPERLNQALALVDQLIAAAHDPGAIQTLQVAKARITTRLESVPPAVPR